MLTEKHHRPVRRAASDSTSNRSRDDNSSLSPGPTLLTVPMLGQTLASAGSCRHLDLSIHENEMTASSDDISPECVSPAVLLVPPPYPEASTVTMDDVSCTSKSDQGIQITVVEEQPVITTLLPTTVTASPKQTQIVLPETRQSQDVTPGQRVRIRLCDTRLDSGIGDDKHSQESQPSSSGACDIEPSHDSSHEVIVQVQHSADLS